MKNFFKYFIVALTFLILGVLLQRNHALTPLKRVLEGRPLTLTPPAHTILDWEFRKRKTFSPQFPLSKLSFQDLDTHRSLYRMKLEELLRLGAFPPDFPLRDRALEKVELSKVFREKIEIEVEEGLWIPFYLFLPKEEAGPRPCIFVFHGHSGGKIETAGIRPSYQKGNALALAEAGFVTVAPDLRGFGELGWPGEWEDPVGHGYGRTIHIQDVLFNLETGRTTLGSFIYDARKILEFLKSRKEVDPEKIGVAGTSLGADVAIWFAALEPRIKTVVADNSSLVFYPLSAVSYGQYHACIDALPGLASFFRLEDIPLLVAGRPFLLEFSGEPRAGSPLTQSRLEALYREADSAEKVRFKFYPGEETFYNETAIEWFKKWLA